MHTLKCSVLSASIVALSTGWAAAAPAVVLDFLNLRSGPGYDYGVIEIIPVGLVVDAGGCVPGWCQVNVNGIIGYVDASYLSFAQAPVTTYGAPPYWTYGPYDGRYTYWTRPYRDYYGLRYDPNYAYFPGYYGGADPDPLASAYAAAPDEGVIVDRRRTNRVRHTAVAKSGGPAAPNVTSPIRRGPATTGAATAAAHPNRSEQNRPQ